MVTPPLDTHALPWIPLREGFAFKPLAFTHGAECWAILLRVDPGFSAKKHRHSGEVHAFHLSGRRALDSGTVLGAGSYLYEPVGNVDTWSSVGDEPLVTFIVASGAVEYFGEDDTIVFRSDGKAMLETYRAFCAAHGAPVQPGVIAPGR